MYGNENKKKVKQKPDFFLSDKYHTKTVARRIIVDGCISSPFFSV